LDTGAMLAGQGGSCAECQVAIRGPYEIDHKVAVALGGSNDEDNLQIVCPDCNRRKYLGDKRGWIGKRT
jgi:5-methylcytosine-specific restriction endonuclease McrA